MFRLKSNLVKESVLAIKDAFLLKKTIKLAIVTASIKDSNFKKYKDMFFCSLTKL